MIHDLASGLLCGFIGCVGIIVLAAIWGIAFTREERRSDPLPASITTSEPQAIALDEFRSWTQLPPNGREVFFPKPTHPNALYQVTLTGILRSDHGRFADAFHWSDDDGNFSKDLHWLRVCGYSLRYANHEFVEEERCDHRYTFRIAARSPRLTLALDRTTDGSSWRGALTVEVTVLPQGTQTMQAQRDQAEVERKRQAAEQALKEEQTAAAKRFADQIQALCIRAETILNWGSPEFREKFARVHAAELVQHQGEIRKEASEFLAQRDAVQFLRRHHPAVVERFLGRLNALLMAEHIVLDKSIAAADAAQPAKLIPPPPRKRLTAEEVRAIKIRRQQVHDQDRVELKLDRIERRLQIRERLDQMPLDPDEREMLEQELIDEIEGDEDANAKTI